MFTHFQGYAEHLKPTLDAAFTKHLAQLLGEARPFRSWGESQLLTGGKKIRGTLLCLVATTLGGTLEDALPRAIAVELIQTATLIHDDFVDQHRSRRNMPAIWTLEGARRAVLLGDIIFSSAIHMMSELGRQDGLIVSRAIAEVSRGAYQEPLNPSALLEEMEAYGLEAALYEKIIYLKTGILFGAACQLGAVAANADDHLQHVWRRYGVKIGEAYQIADDLQEVEQALCTRSITASEMAALAPALLFFDGESRPCILAALRRGSLELGGEIVQQFQAVAESMKAEKERRLRSAVAEVSKDFPKNNLNRLARKTPWDLIRMFDAAMPQVSLQL
jgi:geranylgeranyl pyrophosphate synthase